MSPEWSDKSDAFQNASFELSMQTFGNLSEQSLGRAIVRLQARWGLAVG